MYIHGPYIGGSDPTMNDDHDEYCFFFKTFNEFKYHCVSLTPEIWYQASGAT